MRASYVKYLFVCGAVGCGSSTTAATPPSEAGAVVSEASVLSDARRDLTTDGSGALALAFVGDPCGSDNNCITGNCNQSDMTGFTNGYCTYDCRPGRMGCPVKTSCIALNGDTPICYKSCTSDSDCRTAEGYVCLDVGAPLVVTGTQKVCYPSAAGALNCNYDSDCPPSVPHCTGGLGLPSPPDAGVDDSGDAAPQMRVPQPGNGTCGP